MILWDMTRIKLYVPEILMFHHMIFLILICYLIFIFGISLQLLYLKLIFERDIWSEAWVLGVIIACDIVSLLFFGIGGFLLFYQLWLLGLQTYSHLNRKENSNIFFPYFYLFLLGFSLTFLGNLLVAQGSFFFNDILSININMENLFFGTIVAIVCLDIWAFGKIIKYLKSRKSHFKLQRDISKTNILWATITVLVVELCSLGCTCLLSPQSEIILKFSIEFFLMVILIAWGVLSIPLLFHKFRYLLKQVPDDGIETPKKTKKRLRSKVHFDLGDHDPDSIFYKKDDAIDKKLAQNPEFFLKEKQAAFDRPQIGAEIKKPLYVRFECPICKEKLSMGMMCHHCEIRVCPQCLNPDPIDTSVCECGYTFTSISRIVKFSKSAEKFKDLPTSETFIAKPAESAFISVKGNTKDILPVNISDAKKNILPAKGETVMVRFCPICHVMGWKEDICQCGYNYLTKKLEGKK